jgi:hypothetical protein
MMYHKKISKMLVYPVYVFSEAIKVVLRECLVIPVLSFLDILPNFLAAQNIRLCTQMCVILQEDEVSYWPGIVFP